MGRIQLRWGGVASEGTCADLREPEETPATSTSTSLNLKEGSTEKVELMLNIKRHSTQGSRTIHPHHLVMIRCARVRPNPPFANLERFHFPNPKPQNAELGPRAAIETTRRKERGLVVAREGGEVSNAPWPRLLAAVLSAASYISSHRPPRTRLNRSRPSTNANAVENTYHLCASV